MNVAPAAMFIEAAADELRNKAASSPAILTRQLDELEAAGARRALEGAPDQTAAFHRGYLLGLQTADVIATALPQICPMCRRLYAFGHSSDCSLGPGAPKP